MNSATAQGKKPVRVPDVLRFSVELIAWTATPWALAPHSALLAVLSVIVLIGLPTVFATPGDKTQVMVAVPGAATIALVVLQLAAAVVSSWPAWPPPVAFGVSVLALNCAVAELPRWRALLAG